MNGHPSIEQRKLSLLAEAAISASQGLPDEQILTVALDHSLEILGLVSGSIRLAEPSGKVRFFHVAGRSEFTDLMRDTEEKMLAVLRDEFAVKSLFLTFEQEGLYSLFSYPVRMDSRTLGTISGITTGERNLAQEEEFIKSISAVLALVLSRGTGTGAAKPEEIVKAKAEAVVETAVTINHEVNNPLTAVLGNVQLLLLNAQNLPPDLVARLRAVEEAAMRIKEVTQNLMKVIEPSVIEYTTGVKMVDLGKSKLAKEKPPKRTSEE